MKRFLSAIVGLSMLLTLPPAEEGVAAVLKRVRGVEKQGV